MAQLTVQQMPSSGLNPSFVAASAGGDAFLNDGYTLFRIKNASASPITVTAVAQSSSNHGTKVNETITVPASGDIIAGFFQMDRFNDLYGNVQVTYSAVASVTVAAIQAIGGRR